MGFSKIVGFFSGSAVSFFLILKMQVGELPSVLLGDSVLLL